MQATAAFLPMDRRQAIAQHRTLPEQSTGAALFADISGFTSLTAALAAELGPQRGAEEMLRQINAIFEELIAALHRFGGSSINFAGDAITCWLDKDDGRRAIACGLAMQAAMRRFNQVTTPNGTVVSLGIKVAIAVGPIKRFIVGNPAIQLIDVLAGKTLDHMAEAEQQAARGDLIITADLAHALNDIISIADWRTDPESGQKYALVADFNQHIAETPWPDLDNLALSQDHVQHWIMEPIRIRLAYENAFLAELRPAVPIFLKFSGIEYDTDKTAGQKLNAYICWIQDILAQYDGYLFQVTIGDKGSYLYTAFGAPTAHDDDAARAVAAGNDLLQSTQKFDFISKVQIGISQGRVWSGTYGSATRNTYGAIGSETNMAARLMAAADAGQVLVSQQVATAASRQFEFRDLGPIKVKGREEPIQVADLLQARNISQILPTELYAHPLVGRDDTLAVMESVLDNCLTGHGQILRLEGAAGIGKSHLTAMFDVRAMVKGFDSLNGACQSTTRGIPFAPWRDIFRAAFRISDPETTDPNQRRAQNLRHIVTLEQQLAEMNPNWLVRMPLLGSLLRLPIADNATTAAFDPSLRQEALFSLVTEIIQYWARQQPLLILLEDVHWMDEASQDLVVSVARAIRHTPATLLVVQRPPANHAQPYLAALDQLPNYLFIDLNELSPDGILTLAQNRLGGRLTPLAAGLIKEKAQGNPFFAEELVDALRESQSLISTNGNKWDLSSALRQTLKQSGFIGNDEAGTEQFISAERLATVELGIPDSIHGVVLSRIDRIPDTQKLTLKVASVIGRIFEVRTLANAHPQQPSPTQLANEIQHIMSYDFVRRASGPDEQLFMFKHNITQEVAYETLLFSQRRQLHSSVAEWHEKTFGTGADLNSAASTTLDSPLAPYFSLLVHHWHYAENRDRERIYAELAGRQAAAQYAIEAAVQYYSRALELTSTSNPDDRYRLYMAREAVLDWQGDRDAQAQDLQAAIRIAHQQNSLENIISAQLRQAELARRRGEYDTAVEIAQEVAGSGRSSNNPELQARAFNIWGQVMRQQGNYDEATNHLQHALEIAEKHQLNQPIADNLFQLSNLQFYQGETEAATALYHKSLAIYEKIGDQKGSAGCYLMLGALNTQIGDYSEAELHYQRSLETCQTIGYRVGKTFVLGNLGVNFCDIGNYKSAEKFQLEAIQVCQELADIEGEGISYCNLTNVHFLSGSFTNALETAESALQLNRKIGDRRSEAYTLNYQAHAFAAINDWRSAAIIYEQAYKIRTDIGAQGSAIDSLAGWAYVLSRQGETVQASQHLAIVEQWLAEKGTTGLEYPLHVYWLCYETLVALGQMPKARTMLDLAADLLEQKAAAIIDPDIRHRFMHHIRVNRQIMETWEELAG